MRYKVLTVDDSKTVRIIVKKAFKPFDVEIFEAANGVEGLAVAAKETPDLILVDLSMPELDGWGMLEELRADQRTRHIPCVAVTASADRERERALAQGFDAYLPKPYRRTELIETVERMLNKHQLLAGSDV